MSFVRRLLDPPPDIVTLDDDIKCMEWLNEVELTQYHETFSNNFGIGNDILSRRRLATVRLQDFPNMNITSFDHAKLLLDHIKLTLKYKFDSTDRLKVNRESNDVLDNLLPPITDRENSRLSMKLAELRVPESNRRAQHRRYISGSRRKAFDKKVWNSINKYRDDVNSNALLSLRSGASDALPSSKSTNKQFSFSPSSRSQDVPGSPKTFASKGKAYGDIALDYDTLLKQLKALQAEQLAYYKNLINCEVANIFFLNEKTRELMLYVNDKWFKISSDSGIAGFVARTGESQIIPDAYADSRFNRGMDKKTGFKTRNILCQPIRSKHGGGVVAVVQMLNKKDGQDFDQDDETIVDTCVQRLAEDLEERFKDLLRISEKMSSVATSVNAKPDKVGYMAPKSSAKNY